MIKFSPSLQRNGQQLRAVSLIAALVTALCGCSALMPANLPPPLLFAFDNAQSPVQITSAAKAGAPTLLLSMPHAAAGFDSKQIVYVRQPLQLEHFQKSLWVEAPANMLAPLITAALERSGQFSAVVQAPTSADAQLRLDVEILRLQQEFFSVPSRAHFTLRAHLLDATTHRIIAWREFDAIVPSATDDPYGGVIASNKAVSTVVTELADFCAQASNSLPKTKP